MFIAALFTISKIWKQPKYPSVGEWIKQLWDIYAELESLDCIPLEGSCPGLKWTLCCAVTAQVEFKTMVIRMLKDLRGRTDDLSENLNKEIVSIKRDIETIKKNQL